MGDRRITQHAGGRTGAATLMPYPLTEIRQTLRPGLRPNPRMHPTGRICPGLRLDAAPLEDAAERRFASAGPIARS